MDEGKEGSEVPEQWQPVSATAHEGTSEPSTENQEPRAPQEGSGDPFPSYGPDPTGTEPSTVPWGSSTIPWGYGLRDTGAWAEPPLAPQAPPSEPPRKTRRRGTRVALALVVVVVLAAGALVIANTGGASKTSKKASPTTAVVVNPSQPSSTPPQSTPLDTAGIVKMVDPAIVDINTVTQVLTGYAFTAATGMIISPDGYILTNNHVVENATTITVAIEGHGKHIPATFVGADPSADVAVIKVKGLADLPTVSLASDSVVSNLSIGDPVVAIGNALGKGGKPAVTTGAVVALNRSISASDELTTSPEHLTGLMEASAGIEPGNSGGPLLDADAQVIGMNTAAEGGSQRSNAFAIPISRAAGVVRAIRSGQTSNGIDLGLQAFLGLAVRNQASAGVGVTRIVLGYPAADAGVEPGDTVLAFDGHDVTTAASLKRLVVAQRPGDAATLTVESPTGTSTVSLHLVAGPAP